MTTAPCATLEQSTAPATAAASPVTPATPLPPGKLSTASGVYYLHAVLFHISNDAGKHVSHDMSNGMNTMSGGANVLTQHQTAPGEPHGVVCVRVIPPYLHPTRAILPDEPRAASDVSQLPGPLSPREGDAGPLEPLVARVVAAVAEDSEAQGVGLRGEQHHSPATHKRLQLAVDEEER